MWECRKSSIMYVDGNAACQEASSDVRRVSGVAAMTCEASVCTCVCDELELITTRSCSSVPCSCMLCAVQSTEMLRSCLSAD